MAITPHPKCSVSGLDLTSLPPIQDEIESVQIVESVCFTGLPSKDHLTPLEFRFGGSSDYIDVDSIMVCLQVEIIDKTPPTVAATPPAASTLPAAAPPAENKKDNKMAKNKRVKRDASNTFAYGPTNLFLYSLFERVELKIGGKSNYPYIMYTLLYLYLPAQVVRDYYNRLYMRMTHPINSITLK